MGVLTDLVLPRPCVCGAPVAASALLCADCRSSWPTRAASARPHPAPAGLPDCAVGGWYEGALRRAVITYKERGHRDLAPLLAASLVRAVSLLPALRTAGPGTIVLVPVPPSAAGWRSRGFDHITLLAVQAVRSTGVRMRWAPLLQSARTVVDQSRLTAGGRMANRAFSLRTRTALVGGVVADRSSVVIVDDVMTTGATLAEAARALRASGLRPVGCAAVAGVRRRDDRVSHVHGDTAKRSPDAGCSPP